ncbi:hypothetical protein [Nocardia sp. NPDC057440]|uniref:hypothetical protein n=1 Tax=Nocardia sp. NPDC057440 TaxID=3346134 RepID=UPI00366B22BE
MLLELNSEFAGQQWMAGHSTVEQVGPLPARGPHEELGERVLRRRIGRAAAQRASRRDEQRRRSHTGIDVPGISIGAHARQRTDHGELGHSTAPRQRNLP